MGLKSSGPKEWARIAKEYDLMRKDWSSRKSEFTTFAKDVRFIAGVIDTLNCNAKKGEADYASAMKRLKATHPKLETAQRELVDAEKAGDKAAIRKKKKDVERLDAEVHDIEVTIGGAFGLYWGAVSMAYHDFQRLKFSKTNR